MHSSKSAVLSAIIGAALLLVALGLIFVFCLIRSMPSKRRENSLRVLERVVRTGAYRLIEPIFSAARFTISKNNGFQGWSSS